MKDIQSIIMLSLLAAIALFGSRPALAQSLSFAPTAVEEATPGTFTFIGTVTNDTGVDLRATDLFFDFTGYDPGAVAVNQLLGDTDFPVGNGSTSLPIGLFDVSLSPNASQTYSVVAQLQDVNGSLSDPTAVSVRNVAAVPEPAPASLLLAGFACILPLAARCRRRQEKPSTCIRPFVSAG